FGAIATGNNSIVQSKLEAIFDCLLLILLQYFNVAAESTSDNVQSTFRSMTLSLRSIMFCGGLLLLASTSFAQGEYQQAKDGKTLIWNGTPKPSETATWDGDRDKENYATGFGALTWYTAKGTVYGLYYGN